MPNLFEIALNWRFQLRTIFWKWNFNFNLTFQGSSEKIRTAPKLLKMAWSIDQKVKVSVQNLWTTLEKI